MIARDGNRVEIRHMPEGVFHRVRHQTQGRRYGVNVSPAGDEFLEYVVLQGAAQSLGPNGAPLGYGDVKGQQNDRRGVDGQRGRNFIERNILEEPLHILDGPDVNPDSPHLALGPGVGGVQAHLSGQVKSGGKARLPLGKKPTEALVGLPGGAEAGVLAHGPKPAQVHGFLYVAGTRILAGMAQIFGAGGVLGAVVAAYFYPGYSLECGFFRHAKAEIPSPYLNLIPYAS